MKLGPGYTRRKRERKEIGRESSAHDSLFPSIKHSTQQQESPSLPLVGARYLLIHSTLDWLERYEVSATAWTTTTTTTTTSSPASILLYSINWRAKILSCFFFLRSRLLPSRTILLLLPIRWWWWNTIKLPDAWTVITNSPYHPVNRVD